MEQVRCSIHVVVFCFYIDGLFLFFKSSVAMQYNNLFRNSLCYISSVVVSVYVTQILTREMVLQFELYFVPTLRWSKSVEFTIVFKFCTVIVM